MEALVFIQFTKQYLHPPSPASPTKENKNKNLHLVTGVELFQEW